MITCEQLFPKTGRSNDDDQEQRHVAGHDQWQRKLGNAYSFVEHTLLSAIEVHLSHDRFHCLIADHSCLCLHVVSACVADMLNVAAQ